MTFDENVVFSARLACLAGVNGEGVWGAKWANMRPLISASRIKILFRNVGYYGGSKNRRTQCKTHRARKRASNKTQPTESTLV